MTRLLVSVEGETEEQFVNGILRTHLGHKGYDSISARLIGDARSRRRRGGICKWSEAKPDILRHLKQDAGQVVSIMVDYYALPQDWPGRATAPGKHFSNRVAHLRESLIHDLKPDMDNIDLHSRFVPCILMHEFEALLFSNCAAFADAVSEDVAADMQAIVDKFDSPEAINDSPQTCPSKRISGLIPNYQKPLFGYIGASAIGLERIREKCVQFDVWLKDLEIVGANHIK